jgi:hypothetical protein
MLDAYDRDNTICHLDEDRRFSPDTADVEGTRTIASDDPKPAVASRSGMMH